MRMKLFVLTLAIIAGLTACGRGTLAGPPQQSTYGNPAVTAPGLPVISEGIFVVTRVTPFGDQNVSTPFRGHIEGSALISADMRPTVLAGVIFVEGDGSNRATQWSTLYPLPPHTRDESVTFSQDFFAGPNDHCTARLLCKDYLPGREINAFFVIAKKGVPFPLYWDGDDNVIRWDAIAYRQFIPIGWRFRK